jgi:hypothetical protein
MMLIMLMATIGMRSLGWILNMSTNQQYWIKCQQSHEKKSLILFQYKAMAMDQTPKNISQTPMMSPTLGT